MTDAIDLLQRVVEALLSQAVPYFTLVGVVFLLVWKLGERRFQARRIQAKKRFNAKQLGHEVKYTFVTLAIGTLNAVGIMLLYEAGLTKLSTDASVFGWPVILASFIGLIVLNDTWFYWWHRFMHRPGVFRYAHAVHHKSVDVNPFSSYSFHAIEAFLLGAWALPLFVLVPIYLPMLAAVQVVGLLNNLIAHLGYEFMPRWFIRIPPFRWLTTSTYHNLHHTKLDGNYALFFRGWDRLLGTEVAQYEQISSLVGGNSRAERSRAQRENHKSEDHASVRVPVSGSNTSSATPKPSAVNTAIPVAGPLGCMIPGPTVGSGAGSSTTISAIM